MLFFDSMSDLSSVYIVSDKFSHIVYKAFLKYLYTGTIDLPLENALGNWRVVNIRAIINYNSETEATFHYRAFGIGRDVL